MKSLECCCGGDPLLLLSHARKNIFEQRYSLSHYVSLTHTHSLSLSVLSPPLSLVGVLEGKKYQTFSVEPSAELIATTAKRALFQRSDPNNKSQKEEISDATRRLPDSIFDQNMVYIFGEK